MSDPSWTFPRIAMVGRVCTGVLASVALAAGVVSAATESWALLVLALLAAFGASTAAIFALLAAWYLPAVAGWRLGYNFANRQNVEHRTHLSPVS